MNEYVCGVPGALEQKAREVARKHHLSDLEEEFFLDFVSHITLDMLGISDSQRENELRRREADISSPMFDRAFSDLKEALWLLTLS